MTTSRRQWWRLGQSARMTVTLLLLFAASVSGITLSGCGGSGGDSGTSRLYSITEQVAGSTGDTDFRPAVQFTNDQGAFVADDLGQTVLFDAAGTRHTIALGTNADAPVPTVLGLNNAGQVAGVSRPSGGQPGRSFLWHPDGTVTFLDTSADGGGLSFSARALNDAGQVAGVLTLPGSSAPHVGRWQDGVLEDLGVPAAGAAALSIAGINSRGEVAGSYSPSDPSAAPRGFFYRPETGFLDILPPASRAGDAVAVSHLNDAGQIVGTLQPADGSLDEHAFQWQDGTLTDLTATNSGDGRVRAAVFVTDRGDVALAPGSTIGGGDAYALMLLRGGRVYRASDLIPSDTGWSEVTLDSVNRRGQFFGYGRTNGHWRRFVLTPL